MPSASTAKPEKQASAEASDTIKQEIVFVEHKIRNLVKKKGRLDAYKETQKSGKELDPDQKQALLKYDELCQNLAFAQDFKDQLINIATEASKQLKKKEKKEAREKEQQETNKVKEILVIQDVLASIGTENVREDFLAGRNRAVQLTKAELQYLEDLVVKISPKRETEGDQPPFLEQAQNAAKHLLSIVDGKDKDVVGTRYSELKKIIDKIGSCGYFDKPSEPEPTKVEVVEEEPITKEVEITEPVPVEPEPIIVQPVLSVSATFQHKAMEPVPETAGLYISQRPMADVLTNVMGAGPTSFNFIQESELESEVPVVPTIPSQTFTNASFVVAPAPVYTAPAQPEVAYPAAAAQPAPPPNTYLNTPQASTESSDWNDATEQSNDWATQAEQGHWVDSAPVNDEWPDNSNDGFQTAGRGGSRGGRGRGGGSSDRGRGGSRGRGNYQNGRGNNQNGRGGGSGYRNNSDGGYQNGYQSKGEGYRDNRDGGSRRGGPRGGGGQDRGGPRTERGGPRWSRGGNSSRGNYNRASR